MTNNSSSSVIILCERAARRLANGEIEAANCLLDAAQAASCNTLLPELLRLRGIVAAEKGDFATGVQLLDQALTQTRLLDDHAGEIVTAGDLAALLMRTGQLARAYTLITWSLNHVGNNTLEQHTRLLNIAAIIAMLQGHFDQALLVLDTAQEPAPNQFVTYTALNSAAASSALGHADLAECALDRAEVSLLSQNTYVSHIYGYYRTWCALARDDIQTAQVLCQTAIQQMTPEYHAAMYHPMLATLGVIARERGELCEAERLLQQAFALLQQHNDQASNLGMLWHLALLYQAQGNDQAAAQHLQDALAAMRKDGYGATLLWQPRPFAEMCEWAITRNIEPMYAKWLLQTSLAEWAKEAEMRVTNTEVSTNDMAPALRLLTARQRQVLLLVAQGLSDKDIADTLVVCVSTVQNHLHSIYTKLSVTNRVEATCIVFEANMLSNQYDGANN